MRPPPQYRSAYRRLYAGIWSNIPPDKTSFPKFSSFPCHAGAMAHSAELKVVVLGLGYIGLPTAAVIARTGAKVLGVDVTQSVVDTVNSGKVHIEEVDLDGLVSGVVARGNLRASTTIEPADVFVIAVPTPFAEDHAPNIGYVLQAATTIATVLKAGDAVILESTSPVGTTEKVRDLLAQ